MISTNILLPRIQRSVLYVAILIVVSLTYFGFRPPYHHYFPMIYVAQNPGAFALDPILSNSVYLKASLYYDLIAWLRVPITNDIFGLALHYCLNGIVLWMLYRVLRTRFELEDGCLRLTIVLLSCFFYSKFVMGATAQSIAFNTPTPTGLAQIAGMLALLLVLERRIFVGLLMATLCIAMNPKGNILIVPGLALYTILDRDLPRRCLIWTIIPFAYIAWRAIETHVTGIPIEEARVLIKNIMVREQEDGLISEHPFLAHLFLVTSFLTYPLLSRQFDSRALRCLGWAFMIVTATAITSNIIYPMLSERFPIPVLIMLAIPLATKHYLFLYSTMVAVWIIKYEKFFTHERLALLLSFSFLKIYPAQAIIALTGVIGGVFIPRLGTRIFGSEAFPSRLLKKFDHLPLPLTLGIVLTSFVILRSGTSYVGPSWIDPTAFRQMGSWSSGINADETTWSAWRDLRSDPDDFPLLAIYRRTSPAGLPEDYVAHTISDVITGKSPFATLPAGAYLDLALWQESQKRWEVREEILDRVNNGRAIDSTWLGTVIIRKEKIPLVIDETLTGFLKSRNAAIFVPREIAELFPLATSLRSIGDYVLIRFSK